MIRKIITILIIALVLFSGIPTMPEARAADPNDQIVATAGGCVAGGLLAPQLTKLIDKLTTGLNKKISEMTSKTAQSLAKSFSAGLTSVPTTVTNPVEVQQNIIDTFVNKHYRDDIVARCVVRAILTGLISNINDIIATSGRDGGATFIRNWTNFITQAQYRGENIFRAELSTAKLCSFLSSSIKQSFAVPANQRTTLPNQNTRTDGLQPFNLQTGCTLPNGFDPASLNKDFAGSGGWDAISRLAQPQNNYYGLMFASLSEIQRQRDLAQAADLAQANANRGYTGLSGNNKNDSCLRKSPITNTCIIYKDIKTPGSKLADTVAASVGAEFSWLTNTQELGAVISNMTSALISNLLDSGNPSAYTGKDVDSSYDVPDNNSSGGDSEPGDSVCVANSPQTVFETSLQFISGDVESWNFVSASTFGETSLPDYDGRNALKDRLNNIRSDSAGSQFRNEIEDIKSLIDKFPVVGSSLLEVDPQKHLDTVDRLKLAEDQNTLLNALRALIAKIESTCVKPTPSSTITPKPTTPTGGSTGAGGGGLDTPTPTPDTRNGGGTSTPNG